MFLEIFNLLQFTVNADYFEVKNQLLRECDYSLKAAGEQLFNANPRTLRDKSASDFSLYIERAHQRMVGDAMTIDEYIQKLTYITARQSKGKDTWI